MANDNCLQGLRCPNPACGSEGPFHIHITILATVSDDGFDQNDLQADASWSDDAYCHCIACGDEGTVEDFKLSGEEHPWHTTVVCVFCQQDVPATTAHFHNVGYVGDACCWDNQLQDSE